MKWRQARDENEDEGKRAQSVEELPQVGVLGKH